ncbi:MAG: divergent polysaccharide deacetylase family protein, partial [Caulobacterales bacterium]|nr:divergent polysaccharide deacetylase family protein [Caulobacterales bacterium]
ARIVPSAEPAPPGGESAPPRLATFTLEPAAAPPLVAIVIDDIGLDLAAAERAAALPAPVTLSIFPHVPAAPRIEALARAWGHEVFIHLPMEPRGLDDPGPGALYTWLPADEIRARSRAAFAALPQASGVNNHMGSRFTACAACVAAVAEEAARTGLIVLDSLTAGDSRLADAAATAGGPALARDVFLDNVRDPIAIAARLAEAEDIARARGWAIAIGHPAPETLAVLEEWIPTAQARGLMIAGAGAAARRMREGAASEAGQLAAR